MSIQSSPRRTMGDKNPRVRDRCGGSNIGFAKPTNELSIFLINRSDPNELVFISLLCGTATGLQFHRRSRRRNYIHEQGTDSVGFQPPPPRDCCAQKSLSPDTDPIPIPF